MLRTTVGQMLIDNALPEDMRGRQRVLDKKGLRDLFQEIAERYPEKYREISHKLIRLGEDASTATGGYSFGLEDMKLPPEARIIRDQLAKKTRAIQVSSLPDKEKEALLIKTIGEHSKPFQDSIYDITSKAKNPLTMQVVSGARGNAGNLRSIMGGDLLYQDNNSNVVPVPILHGYAEGLRPAEYWAGTFGARKGVVELKKGTALGGYFGKQLNQIAHRLIVTAHDAPEGDPHHAKGLPMETLDPDNAGALLARGIGSKYKRDTVLTPKILTELHNSGHEEILVRSPILGGPEDGGVYAKDVGIRERGGYSPKGDYVGLAASSALAEPLVQSMICLGGDTLVRMADFSVKPIKDIQPDEWVIGCDKRGDTFPVRVIARHDNGLRECVKTIFSRGKRKESIELISTPEHKMLSLIKRTGTAPMTAIAENPVGTHVNRTGKFYAVLGGRFNDTGAGLVKEPFALLIGLLLGDGCYTKSIGFNPVLTCADKLLVEDIQPLIAPLNLHLVLEQANGGDLQYRLSQIKEIPSQRDAKGRVCAGFRNPAKFKLQSLRMLGKYAHEKVIPDEAYGWDNASIRELLAGLFVTDGSVYVSAQSKARNGSPSLNFGSTSRRLVEQFAEFLAVRFGIHVGTIHVNNSSRKRTMYSWVVSGYKDVCLFAEQIPLYGVKRDRIKNLIAAAKIPNDNGSYYPARRVQIPIGLLPTYDLEVDHPEHKFLLHNGLAQQNSSKHSGGVVGAGNTQSGFKYINAAIQAPKVYAEGLTHAQNDGKVGAMWNAPAGGSYMMIDGVRHFIAHGHSPTVKPGDSVEAGDALSDGLPNPSEIVEHKGIGEGRRQFVNLYRKLYKNSGIDPHRRNIELLARGLINHVRLDDNMGDYAPGDVIPYDILEHSYVPRDGHDITTPKRAKDMYLERPALHYTIGTKIRPSVIKMLDKHGVNAVVAHKDPPPFHAEFIRGAGQMAEDTDWMTKQLGSNLKKSLLTAAVRGAVADEGGSSFVPGLARGVDFGKTGLTKSWERKDIIKP